MRELRGKSGMAGPDGDVHESLVLPKDSLEQAGMVGGVPVRGKGWD